MSLLGEKFAVVTGKDQTIAVGGTSASTPTWGAIISLLNEELRSTTVEFMEGAVIKMLNGYGSRVPLDSQKRQNYKNAKKLLWEVVPAHV